MGNDPTYSKGICGYFIKIYKEEYGNKPTREDINKWMKPLWDWVDKKSPMFIASSTTFYSDQYWWLPDNRDIKAKSLNGYIEYLRKYVYELK